MTSTSPLLIPSRKANAHSSFRLPMQLLPKQQRQDLKQLYIICRTLDDAVDEAPSAEEALHALDIWEEDLAAIYDGGKPRTRLGGMLAELCTRHDLSRFHWQDMAAALRMDAEGEMVNPSMAHLQIYCYGVASCVGLLSMPIFGCDTPDGQHFAIELGHAMQLTNIIRDVWVDAQIGRVYLPREAAPDLLPHLLLDEDVREACALLGAMAQHHFNQAEEAAATLPSREITPALAMGKVYRYYLSQLEANDWHPPENGELSLTMKEKIELGTDVTRWLRAA